MDGRMDTSPWTEGAALVVLPNGDRWVVRGVDLLALARDLSYVRVERLVVANPGEPAFECTDYVITHQGPPGAGTGGSPTAAPDGDGPDPDPGADARSFADRFRIDAAPAEMPWRPGDGLPVGVPDADPNRRADVRDAGTGDAVRDADVCHWCERPDLNRFYCPGCNWIYSRPWVVPHDAPEPA